MFEERPSQQISIVRLEVRRSRSTSANVAEHVGIHPRLLAGIGAEPRQQVRVSREGTTALFTLVPGNGAGGIDTVQVTDGGCRRIGAESGHAVVLDLRCIDPTMSEAEAEVEGEFIERLEDDGRHHRLAVLAPHGGAIESHTDRQAEQVYASLGSRDSTLWTCKGWRPVGNAYRAWHISSGDLSVRSFPLLRSLAARRFRWAVSFHGYRGDDVLIGGRAPARLKSEVLDAVATALDGTGIRVRVADPGERYSGESASNLVNRLTVGAAGGIQIEQPRSARTLYGQAIAAAVGEVCESWIAADSGR
ncbi:hypothetical protein ROP_04040 [Rhodococcus opacus B4]|uniref:Phage replication-related protein YjqB (UPF0714/DUF867 family) n=2 Tax=Rhodococcus opacus TaxID=37919 RepID=C1ARH4_RHOOB|nr:hypothetical protein ROP_04040 [Rhodococcus opacus B4]